MEISNSIYNHYPLLYFKCKYAAVHSELSILRRIITQNYKYSGQKYTCPCTLNRQDTRTTHDLAEEELGSYVVGKND